MCFVYHYCLTAQHVNGLVSVNLAYVVSPSQLYSATIFYNGGGIAQLVERLPLTLKVPGSNPSRSGSEKKEGQVHVS